MIKTKVIETPKGRLLVVGGLPDDVDIWIDQDGRGTDIRWGNEGDKGIKYNHPNHGALDIPDGNWQLLGKLLDIKEADAEKIIPPSFYKHLDKKRGLWYAALLHQWIESKIPLRNANAKCSCKLGTQEFEKCPWINKSLNSCRIYEVWQAEEAKVFHNPILFFEPK